jgi:hypothetical protein
MSAELTFSKLPNLAVRWQLYLRPAATGSLRLRNCIVLSDHTDTVAVVRGRVSRVSGLDLCLVYICEASACIIYKALDPASQMTRPLNP